MIYYRNPADCPSRDKLATMTLDQAAQWARAAGSHCMEVNRRAQIQAFFRITREQEEAAFDAAGSGRRAAATYASELTPIGEQLVIPGCERNLAPSAKQLDLF